MKIEMKNIIHSFDYKKNIRRPTIPTIGKDGREPELSNMTAMSVVNTDSSAVCTL